MDRITRLAALSLITTSIWAVDFQSGQAARAVIGQPSFSSRQASITPLSLSISGGHLYVADASHRLLTFDLGQIPGSKDDLADRQGSACIVCGFSPIASTNQSVLPGIGAVSVFGKTIVIADTTNGQVLLWRDSSLPRSSSHPDIVLGQGSMGSSLSASTLLDPISVAFDGKRLFVGDATLHRVLVWNSFPVFDNQPADAVLGQPNFSSSNLSENPEADSIWRPSALASDGTNLFVADSRDHRILVFSAGDSPLPGNAVMSSATLVPGPVAPGTLVTIAVAGLAETNEAAPDGAGQQLPLNLAGVEVFLDGVALPILEVSTTQIRAQFPYNLGNVSSASLYVRTQRLDGTVVTTNAAEVKLLATAPGLFAFAGDEPRPGMSLHAPMLSADSVAPTPVTSESPAKAGEILVLWAAGLGAINAGDATNAPLAGVPYDGPDAPVLSPVTATVDGRPVEVLSATLPQGAIGVYEVRILLPSDLSADEKMQLLISQDGRLSNTVTIPIDNTVN